MLHPLICTSSDLVETAAKFPKDSGKIVGAVAFTIYQVPVLW